VGSIPALFTKIKSNGKNNFRNKLLKMKKQFWFKMLIVTTILSLIQSAFGLGAVVVPYIAMKIAREL
jgi:hypothetical protein